MQVRGLHVYVPVYSMKMNLYFEVLNVDVYSMHGNVNIHGMYTYVVIKVHVHGGACIRKL